MKLLIQLLAITFITNAAFGGTATQVTLEERAFSIFESIRSNNSNLEQSIHLATESSTINMIKSKTCAVYEIVLPVNLSDDLRTLFLQILYKKGYVDHDPSVHGDNLALVPIVTMNKKTTSCESCGQAQMEAIGKDSEFKHNIIVADFKLHIVNSRGLKYSENYDYMTASKDYVNSNENSKKEYTTEEEGEASAINDFIGKVIVGMDSSLPSCVIKVN